MALMALSSSSSEPEQRNYWSKATGAGGPNSAATCNALAAIQNAFWFSCGVQDQSTTEHVVAVRDGYAVGREEGMKM